MIATVLTALGIQQQVTSPVNLNGATTLRVYNTSGGDVLVSIYASDGITVVGTVTIPSGTVEYIRKDRAEYIGADGACLVVPVGN